jgi:hypothetical protein
MKRRGRRRIQRLEKYDGLEEDEEWEEGEPA